MNLLEQHRVFSVVMGGGGGRGSRETTTAITIFLFPALEERKYAAVAHTFQRNVLPSPFPVPLSAVDQEREYVRRGLMRP